MLHFIADHRRCSFPMNCDELGFRKPTIGDDLRSSPIIGDHRQNVNPPKNCSPLPQENQARKPSTSKWLVKMLYRSTRIIPI